MRWPGVFTPSILDIEDEAFDMTPVIDVVFLLIIFFMLVCQFIVAERFRVQVPKILSLQANRRTMTDTDAGRCSEIRGGVCGG